MPAVPGLLPHPQMIVLFRSHSQRRIDSREAPALKINNRIQQLSRVLISVVLPLLPENITIGGSNAAIWSRLLGATLECVRRRTCRSGRWVRERGWDATRAYQPENPPFSSPLVGPRCRLVSAARRAIEQVLPDVGAATNQVGSTGRTGDAPSARANDRCRSSASPRQAVGRPCRSSRGPRRRHFRWHR